MARRTFQPSKPLYKGNLHTHTRLSDGLYSPASALEWYSVRGYDFVALTDHWVGADEHNDSRPLVIRGVELHGTDPQLGMYHCVGLNVAHCPDKATINSAADAVSYLLGEGGLAVLCHPYWCGMSSAAVSRIEGVFALEVYNSTCEMHIAKGLSAVHWDDVLASGKRVWGLAVDDTHWRGDEGGGWVMVQADALSVEALLAALAAGRFYATSGPAILDFWVEEDIARARTSPARRLAFLCDSYNGQVSFADSAQPDITEAEFALPEGITYVRLEVDDGDHKRAWSNPIFLQP